MVLVHEKFLGKNLAEWEKAVLLQSCSGDGQGAGEGVRKKEGLRFGGLKKKTYLCAPKREREGRGRPGRPGVLTEPEGRAASRQAGRRESSMTYCVSKQQEASEVEARPGGGAERSGRETRIQTEKKRSEPDPRGWGKERKKDNYNEEFDPGSG